MESKIPLKGGVGIVRGGDLKRWIEENREKPTRCYMPTILVPGVTLRALSHGGRGVILVVVVLRMRVVVRVHGLGAAKGVHIHTLDRRMGAFLSGELATPLLHAGHKSVFGKVVGPNHVVEVLVKSVVGHTVVAGERVWRRNGWSQKQTSKNTREKSAEGQKRRESLNISKDKKCSDGFSSQGR